MFLTSVSGLSRTRGLARGVGPLGDRHTHPAAHRYAPKMAPVIPGRDLALDPGQNQGKKGCCCHKHMKKNVLLQAASCGLQDYSSQCQSSGPVPTEVHAGTTPALVPAPTLTGATPGAVLVAGNIADEGATADPQCQIVADTLATG